MLPNNFQKDCVAMKSAMLSSYSSNLRKVAESGMREDQLRVIREASFKASLVQDPFRMTTDLVGVIDIARRSSRN